MKYQISATEYKNQSETKIRNPKLSELYASGLFKLKYCTTLTGLTSLGEKQNVRLLQYVNNMYITIKLTYQTTITAQFEH